jgi:hypothetical protein
MRNLLAVSRRLFYRNKQESYEALSEARQMSGQRRLSVIYFLIINGDVRLQLSWGTSYFTCLVTPVVRI